MPRLDAADQSTTIRDTCRDDPWELYRMALEDVTRRMARIRGALEAAEIPFAIVGGQAVALWVATRDPAAVRTTKNVDLLIRRSDLPAARAAARGVELDYFETKGVGMFLERTDPNPRHAVHLVWAGSSSAPVCRSPRQTLTTERCFQAGIRSSRWRDLSL